jgi:succinate dehydrogenase / fumarate reductase iron-sulfur subunit
VIRDLMVDRRRLFRALTKTKSWIPVDGYYDMGPGPKQSQKAQELMYPLSECMSCGCCLEACPQYNKIEIPRQEGESEDAWHARKDAEYDKHFVGAHATAQVVLFNMNPTGASNADERTDAMIAEGGIQICGNAQNCVAVCPKHIPLTSTISRIGWWTTVRMFKRFFGS